MTCRVGGDILPYGTAVASVLEPVRANSLQRSNGPYPDRIPGNADPLRPGPGIFPYAKLGGNVLIPGTLSTGWSLEGCPGKGGSFNQGNHVSPICRPCPCNPSPGTDPVSTFCGQCGASIPHRPGEGRCPACVHHRPASEHIPPWERVNGEPCPCDRCKSG